MTNSRIRPAVRAGSFYPADSAQLEQVVQDFLTKAKTKSKSGQAGQPSIIIVPHAGYRFSGQVAAAAFKQPSPEEVKQVFLLGSSHQVHIDQAALSGFNQWQTPLGLVELDRQLISNLNSQPGWQINDRAHQAEHCLEVELPFLQQQLEEFKLIPILVGGLSEKALQQVVNDITAEFTQDSLLVISSDLSHYPDYELAQQADQELIQAILDQDIDKFKQLSRQIKPEENLQTRICGEQAVEIGLQIAQKLNLKRTVLYQYKNSGDVTGDYSKVVGYASLGFYAQAEES